MSLSWAVGGVGRRAEILSGKPWFPAAADLSRGRRDGWAGV